MNLWKAFALIMIGILIIVVGVRLASVDTHPFSLSEEQKDFAMKAASESLKDDIEGMEYNATVSDRGWMMATAYGEKSVASVVFISSNTTVSALVDLETGDVIKKSRIVYSGWMTEHRRPERRPRRQFFG